MQSLATETIIPCGLRLNVDLDNGLLRRRSEPAAAIDEVVLQLSARANDIAVGAQAQLASLDLKIPSARVKDVTAYTEYLPKGAPLRLLSGKAELAADVRLPAGTDPEVTLAAANPSRSPRTTLKHLAMGRMAKTRNSDDSGDRATPRSIVWLAGWKDRGPRSLLGHPSNCGQLEPSNDQPDE